MLSTYVQPAQFRRANGALSLKNPDTSLALVVSRARLNAL